MSLLTELDSFTLPFLQICQSYGLRRLRALRAIKNSNANCPKRPTQNDFGTAFVPTGQPDNSPAFQGCLRTTTSPTGTAEWTAYYSRRLCIRLKIPVVPAGLETFAD